MWLRILSFPICARRDALVVYAENSNISKIGRRVWTFFRFWKCLMAPPGPFVLLMLFCFNNPHIVPNLFAMLAFMRPTAWTQSRHTGCLSIDWVISWFGYWTVGGNSFIAAHKRIGQEYLFENVREIQPWAFWPFTQTEMANELV